MVCTSFLLLLKIPLIIVFSFSPFFFPLLLALTAFLKLFPPFKKYNFCCHYAFIYGGAMLGSDTHPYNRTAASLTSGYLAYILVNEAVIVWVMGVALVNRTCVCVRRMSGGGLPMNINTAGGHSRGVSSYKHFPYKVVGKYWPSSEWPPLVAQWILLVLPTLLVTHEDLLPRCLQRCYILPLVLAKAPLSEIWQSPIFFLWRLQRRYLLSSGTCKGSTSFLGLLQKCLHLKYDGYPSSSSDAWEGASVWNRMALHLLPLALAKVPLYEKGW